MTPPHRAREGCEETQHPEGRAVAAAWLAALDAAVADRDADAIGALFAPDGWWRDLVALTWDLRSCHGEAIGQRFADSAAATGAHGFVLRPGAEPVVASDGGVQRVQAFVEFGTGAGRGNGFLRLVRPHTDGPWLAWTFLTALDSLAARPERVGALRPTGVEDAALGTWPQRRAREREFSGADPEVLVVGAGQSGLALAARLGRLGVSTLIVERHARVGDNWRTRYDSLVLHDPVWFDHMPYLPFPDAWPVFAPKDKLADWLEAYAGALEFNVWTSAEIAAAGWDPAAGRWDVTVRRADGTERVMRPAHVVLASGLNGAPVVPDLPGAAEFGGLVCHSSAFPSGGDHAGARAVVVGTGSSAHDIAEELYDRGAAVTMLQRSPAYVVSRDNALRVLFAGLYEEGGPPTADADLMAAGMPLPLVAVLRRRTTELLAKLDADLLAGLEKAGFALGFGPTGGGIGELVLTRGGGYYIDTGASALIIDGRIAVRRGEIAALTPGGLLLADGAELAADVVVLATGYRSMRSAVGAILGPDAARRCGPVWGLDADGELQGMWRRTGQDGLWLMGGNLQMSRLYSKYVALQIAAFQAGLQHW